MIRKLFTFLFQVLLLITVSSFYVAVVQGAFEIMGLQALSIGVFGLASIVYVGCLVLIFDVSIFSQDLPEEKLP